MALQLHDPPGLARAGGRPHRRVAAGPRHPPAPRRLRRGADADIVAGPGGARRRRSDQAGQRPREVRWRGRVVRVTPWDQRRSPATSMPGSWPSTPPSSASVSGSSPCQADRMVTWDEWRARATSTPAACGVATYDVRARGRAVVPTVTFCHGYPLGLARHRRGRGARSTGCGSCPRPAGVRGVGQAAGRRGRAHVLDPAAADAVEALWAAKGTTSTLLVAHDYSVSVAQELLARRAEGRSAPRRWPSEITGVVWMNGGLYPDLHRPTAGQAMLLDPDHGAELAAAWTRPPSPTACAARGASGGRSTRNGRARDLPVDGRRRRGPAMHDLLHYVADRRAHADRWRRRPRGRRRPDGVRLGPARPRFGWPRRAAPARPRAAGPDGRTRRRRPLAAAGPPGASPPATAPLCCAGAGGAAGLVEPLPEPPPSRDAQLVVDPLEPVLDRAGREDSCSAISLLARPPAASTAVSRSAGVSRARASTACSAGVTGSSARADEVAGPALGGRRPRTSPAWRRATAASAAASAASRSAPMASKSCGPPRQRRGVALGQRLGVGGPGRGEDAVDLVGDLASRSQHVGGPGPGGRGRAARWPRPPVADRRPARRRPPGGAARARSPAAAAVHRGPGAGRPRRAAPAAGPGRRARPAPRPRRRRRRAPRQAPRRCGPGGPARAGRAPGRRPAPRGRGGRRSGRRPRSADGGGLQHGEHRLGLGRPLGQRLGVVVADQPSASSNRPA